MQVIFQVLYDINPVLPILYLIIFGLGIIGSAVYCGIKKIPYSIGLIFENAKKGDRIAFVIIGMYAVLVSLTVGIFVVNLIIY